MPVHGEWRHLRAHAQIALSMGIAPERIMLAEDGTVVDLVDGVATIVGTIPVGYVYVDGLAVGDIGDAALKDRRILGEEGFLSILVAVDMEAGKVVFGPELTARGFSDDQEALEPIRVELIQLLESAVAEGTRDADALEHLVRRSRRTLGRSDLPPPPDARAQGRRGLTGRPSYSGTTDLPDALPSGPSPRP